MTLILLLLGFGFSLFPYTQIINIGSYNQPYALAFSSLAVLGSITLLTRYFPRTDFLILLLFALLGVTTFLFTALSGTSAQDLKYLLIYMAPLVFCMASFSISYRYPFLTDRMLVGAAVIWMLVGVIQTLFDPTFLASLIGEFEEVADAVVESGRGVIGLAPEPTHYGFHLIVLGAAMSIIRPRFLMPLVCVAAALLIARSSSALMAITLGSVLYLLVYTRRARLLLLGLIPAYFLVQLVVMSDLLPGSIRIVSLLRIFFQDPLAVITEDPSTNARLGGAYIGFYEILKDLGIPHGMSSENWLGQANRILSEHQWLYDISGIGIPSGLLIVGYQTGWFGLILLGAMIRQMFLVIGRSFEAWMLCILFFVFMAQFYISTPGFGLIYGLMLARSVRSREAAARTPNALQVRRIRRLGV